MSEGAACRKRRFQEPKLPFRCLNSMKCTKIMPHSPAQECSNLIKSTLKRRKRIETHADSAQHNRRTFSSDEEDSADELLYTKTQDECSPLDNEEESSSQTPEGDEDGEDDDFHNVDAEFECFDPSEKFYHGIRHFVVESILPGLAIKDGRRKKKKKKNGNEELSTEAESGDLPSTESLDGTMPTLQQQRPLASRLADCICNQGNIGTVLCVPTDTKSSDVAVGFSTLLNFDQYFPEGLKEIKHALLGFAKRRLEPREYRIFRSVLDPCIVSKPVSKNVIRLHKKRGVPLPVSAGGLRPIPCLFLNERFINLPHQVVPALLSNLGKDVAWSQTTPVNKRMFRVSAANCVSKLSLWSCRAIQECPKNERPYYFFTHIIGLSHCYELSRRDAKTLESKKKTVLTKTTSQESGDSEVKPKSILKSSGTELQTSLKTNAATPALGFKKFEDEIFVKHSTLYFTIPTSLTSRIPAEDESQSQSSTPSRLTEAPEHRLVYLLPYDKFGTVVAECRRVVRDACGLDACPSSDSEAES